MMRRLLAGLLVTFAVAIGGSNTSVRAADGDIDSTFGVAGKVITELPSPNDDASFGDMAIQSDGKIVMAYNGLSSVISIARFNTDGSLDRQFGVNGVTTLDIPGKNDAVRSLLIQDDGRIIIAGNVATGILTDSLLARFTRDGVLDNSFGTNGIATFDFGTAENINSITSLSDNSIVAAGFAVVDNTTGNDFLLARISDTGARVSTFGTNGAVITDLASTGSVVSKDVFQAVTVHNNEIVVVGYRALLTGSYDDDVVVAQYDSNGDLDLDFGVDGYAITDLGSAGDYANAVDVQNDGKIIIAGYSRPDGRSEVALMRYSPTGALDTDFGSNGKVLTNYSAANEVGNNVLLQSDGKIVVTGYSAGTSGSDFLILRFTTTGDADTTFGSNGRAITDIRSSEDRVVASAIDVDGKIVVGGFYEVSGNLKLALVRYNATSSNSSLSSLTASIDLSGAFETNTTSYTATVPNATKSFTITATPTDRYATVSINGTALTSGESSEPIPLTVGVNDVSIKVTAQNQIDSTTYIISVTRQVGELKIRKKLSLQQVLATVDKKLSKGSTTKVTIAKSSRSQCAIIKGKIVGLKKGVCRVTVSSTPPPSKRTPRPKTLRTQVTLLVV